MENKIKSLIIDDDPFIMELLQDKLMQHLPEIEIIATANSGTEGLKKIAEFQPDLVFLDVEMLDMTGFEMLSQLKTIQFQTIFITSYNHYAIKAIRFNALDYLLKPIDLGELKKAVKRYKVKSEAGYDTINTALHNLQTTDMSEHKLVLRTQEGEVKLILKDIIRIVGERNYSYIYLTNSKRKLVTKTLADMEDLLSDKGFFRCHKSFLVNRLHITSLVNSVTLKMSDQIQTPISRRKKESFKIWFEALV
jgi:two-component system LytT family response regulator